MGVLAPSSEVRSPSLVLIYCSSRLLQQGKGPVFVKLREVPLTALIWVVLGPAVGGQTMTKHSRYSEYILSSDINIATRTTHSVFVYADRRQPRLGSRLWWLEGRQTNTNYLLDENTHHHNTHHAQPQHCCPLHQVSGTWSRGGMQGKVKICGMPLKDLFSLYCVN